ncbi:MAG: hypothetical protein KF816_09935 [Melioribacteraceae bacterium]|nr:hypothetical protein [Melioribacteraceae bacterium]
MKIDEYYNHIPLLQLVHNDGFYNVISSDNYLAANTPLPYLIGSNIATILFTEPTIFLARIINALFALGSLLLIYYFFNKSVKSRYPLLKSLIILFYPYFMKPAFSYYMAIYGIFFFIVALILIHDLKSDLKYLFASTALSLAILSQQFYLSVIIALAVILVQESFIISEENRLRSFSNRSAKPFIYLIIPILILLLPLFILWGGLTHPNYSFHRVSFDLTRITIILIPIGIFLTPINIINILSQNKFTIIIVVIFALIMALFNYPNFADRGGEGRITGISFHFINIISNMNWPIGIIVKTAFISLGIFNILSISKKTVVTDSPFRVIFFLLLAGFLFNQLLAERHLLPLIVSGYLLLLSSVNNKTILRMALIVQMFIGTTYYLYYMFIQKSY